MSSTTLSLLAEESKTKVKSEEVLDESTNTNFFTKGDIKDENKLLEEALPTSDHDVLVMANINKGKENEKNLFLGQLNPSTVAVQTPFTKNKKNTILSKKVKHNKYEKPSDQTLKHYKCTHCPKLFPRISSLNVHQRTHNARPFLCQICKNTFLYRCQLREHTRVHTGERPFKCHSCSKTFARKSCLVAHMVTHSNCMPFQCHICTKRFGRKYNLAKHLQSHSEEKPYQCLHCSRQFKCKQSLDKHQMIHKLSIYSCSICKKTFDSKRRLTHHTINEHVSYRPFTCQICHKQFIFKSQLTYHFKEHKLEKPFSCGKCKKSYFKKGHLLSHIKQYCSTFIPKVKVEALS